MEPFNVIFYLNYSRDQSRLYKYLFVVVVVVV